MECEVSPLEFSALDAMILSIVSVGYPASNKTSLMSCSEMLFSRLSVHDESFPVEPAGDSFEIGFVGTIDSLKSMLTRFLATVPWVT